MTDIKELRRLAEDATPGGWEAISDTVEGVDCEFIAHILTSRFSATYDDKGEIAHIGNACDAEFIAAANPSAILSLLDKIDAQDKGIAELHTSIAGAVQHGEQGWQRYEAANKMCLNQQKEIARLNEVIAELRKDAEQAYSILTKSKTKVEDLDVHEEITAFIKSHTSTQEVG